MLRSENPSTSMKHRRGSSAGGGPTTGQSAADHIHGRLSGCLPVVRLPCRPGLVAWRSLRAGGSATARRRRFDFRCWLPAGLGQVPCGLSRVVRSWWLLRVVFESSSLRWGQALACWAWEALEAPKASGPGPPARWAHCSALTNFPNPQAL